MLRIRLAGGLVVEVDGQQVEVPASWSARSLLAWLALHPGDHRRADLAARFWPDILDTSARASLRTALWSLRKVLGPDASDYLIATRDTVGLAAAPSVWVDVGEFEALAAGGQLSEALELCSGDLLAGFDEDWAYEARDEHRERVANVLGRLADAEEADGDLPRAIAHTRAQVDLDPLSEAHARDLLRRLADAGEPAAALAAYEQLLDRLRRKLGLAASAETRELAERIRSGQLARGDEGPADVGTPPLPPLLSPRSMAPFVGREEPLRELQRQWQATRDGERRVVFIAGEPGIGKTRLVSEFAHRVHPERAIVLYGRSYEETLVPYQPFVEALRYHVATRSPERIRSRLPGGGQRLGRLIPELADGLADRGAVPAGEPGSERYWLFEEVAALLTGASRQDPVVLILDDLHWADRPSLLLLEHLARHPDPSAMLVLGTYRDAGVSGSHPLALTLANLRRELEFERFRLRGLSEQDVHTLAAGSVTRELPASFTRALWGRTEGNPFFVHELLRQRARAVGEGADAPIDQVGVPEGVREVIGKRLATLSEAARRALIVASVIGPEFSSGLLERVCDPSDEGAVSALEEASAEQLIEELPGPTPRYGFSHALIHETLYRGLAAARRVRLHQRVGEALEQQSGSGTEAELAELAHHFLAAATDREQLEKATGYLIAAAERATEQLAYEKAAEHYQRALTALEPTDPEPERRCALLLGLGESLWSAGEFARSRDAFRSAADVSGRAGLADELARAALGFGGRTGFEIVVINPTLVGLLEAALDALGEEDSALRARVAVRLGEALMFSPARQRARELAGRAVEMARRLGDEAVLAEVLNNANWILWTPDNLAERLERAREIVRLADATGAPRLQIEGRTWLGSYLLEGGHREAAEREFDACAAIAEGARQPYHLWGTELISAMRSMFGAHVDDVERGVWQALETGQTGQIPAAAHLFGTQIFHVRLQQGRAAEVRAATQGYADAFPEVPALRCGLALTYCELGLPDPARRELELVARNGFTDIPRDFVWLSAMDLLCEVCAYLGDEHRAAQLYDLLAPYAHHYVVASAFAVPRGSVERLLGVLAATIGRYDDAIRHLEVALDRNAGAGPLSAVAQTRHDLARTLVARDGRGDRDRGLRVLAEALQTAERIGLRRLVERSHALRREARRESVRPTPDRRTFSQLAGRASADARAAVSTRGRAALARFTGDLSDQALERRFGSRTAQRALLVAMTRSFQPRLSLGFQGEVQFELTHESGSAADGSDWWSIEIDAKRASARRRPAREPALTMHLGVPEFVRIFAGVSNPILAWVEGRLLVEGDVLLGARLIEMFGGINPAEILARPGSP